MAEQIYGKIKVRGTPEQCALTKAALDECVNLSIPLQDAIQRVFVIEYHTRQEFLDAGAIIPGSKDGKHPLGIPAEGKVMPGGELWVRSDIAANKPGRAKHINRHEISHVYPLSSAKRTELMTHMQDRNGNHPTKWRGQAYEARPNECFADSFAEAASGKDSPWDDFAFFALDVPDAEMPLLVQIAERVDPAPPEPEDPPEVLPPVDPEKVQLQLDLAAANAKLAAIHETSAPEETN